MIFFMHVLRLQAWYMCVKKVSSKTQTLTDYQIQLNMNKIHFKA